MSPAGNTMIKRHVAPIFFLILLAADLALAAQDKATPPASQLSGSIALGVGERNLLGSPYVQDTPGISSSISTASASIKFADGVAYPYLDIYQPLEEVRRATRMGYEAGVVFDAARLLSYLPQTTRISSNGDSSYYVLLQPMIDWYENNRGRYGMSASPYSTGLWPTDNYDGSSSGRTRFIYGRTVEPISYVAWDFNKWYDAQKLFNEIKLKIELAIDGISPDASSGKIVNQYSYQALPQAKRVLAQNELKAWTDFHAIVDGVDAKASLNGPNFQSAYVKFTNIGGFLDARLDFTGAKLSSGILIPSARMDQPATGPALGLALPAGLIPGLNLSVAASLVGGSASIVENYETKNSEAQPGDASWLGVKVKGGYGVPDFANVSLSLLWPDIVSRPLTLASTLNANIAQNGELSYSAAFEGSFLLWQDRYAADPQNIVAYAAGIDAGMTAFGLSPRLLVLYKSADFWGQGGNDYEDRFPGYDLQGDFDSAKVKDAAALDCRLGFDPAPFIGMKLVSVEGGYKLFLYDILAAGGSALGKGWYAGARFDLLDLAEIPIGVSGRITNYVNWGLYAGRYSDWNRAPAPGLLDGLTWSASLDWDPSKEIRISLEGSGRETGWRMDTQPLVSVGLRASIKF
jgi:hypothetical protein